MKAHITSQALDLEKHRVFVEGRSGISLPAAGALYWTILGIAGFFLSDYQWCLAALFTSGLIFPLGMLLSKPLNANLFVDSPLTDIWLPAFMPVFLSFGITIPAFYADMSLLPLCLAIAMSLHWSVFGWLYKKQIFLIHAIARTLIVVLIWFLLPDARFTLLPLAVGVIYMITFSWLLIRLRDEA